MKKLKTTLIISAIAIMIASCAKPATDNIVGTYNGTYTDVGGDTTANCVVEKINDNLVKITCNPSGGSPIPIDSVSVSGTASPYSLSGPMSGSVNNNTISWTSGPFGFIGTK